MLTVVSFPETPNSSRSRAARSPGRQRNTFVEIGPRSRLERPLEHRQMLLRQARHLARSLAVQEPGRSVGVEPHHPVPHDLQPDAPIRTAWRSAPVIVDRGQRQKPTGLLRAFRLAFASLFSSSDEWSDLSLMAAAMEKLPRSP